MRTANELALLFAEIEDPKRSSADRQNVLARRLRHFSQAGLIKSTGQPRDKRGTEQFDLVAACTARILSEFADFVIGGDLLRRIAEILAPRASGVFQNGKGDTIPYWDLTVPDPHSNDDPERSETPPCSHIAHLPKNIRSGEVWELRLSLTAQGSSRSINGGLFLFDNPVWPDAADLLAHALPGFHEVGRLTFNATELCKPVIAAYDLEA